MLPLEERRLLREHIARLSESDRRHRYDPGMEEADLHVHFARDRPVHEVIGWFEDDMMRGAIEIYYQDDRAEAGLTLEEAWRGKGIAVELVRHAMQRAGSHGTRNLAMQFDRGNRSMTEIAAMLSSPSSFGHWRGAETTAAGASRHTWIDFEIEGPAEEDAGGGLVGRLKGLLARLRG